LNSLLQLLTQFGNILQTHMFPVLQEGIGQLNEDHQQLVRILTLLLAAYLRRGLNWLSLTMAVPPDLTHPIPLP
jgi:hypothetical protein